MAYSCYDEGLARGGNPNYNEGFDTLFQLNNQYPSETSTTPRIGNRETGISTGPSYPINPIGSTAITTPIIPQISTPTMGELPNLIIPEIDEKRISELTRKLSDPAIRSLSRTTRQALMRHYENPNVAKMISRETLAGYGESLAKALSSAGLRARGEEREERQIKTTKALTEYQAQVNRQNTVYAAAWNNYMAQFGRTTSTQYIYPQVETSEPMQGYVPEITNTR